MQDRSMETAAKTGSSEPKTRKGNRGSFTPGDPRIQRGPGRPRKTVEFRAIEAMTRKQVEEACDKLVGIAVERVVKILQKGDDSTAWKAAESFIARSIGPVPSAQFIAANVSGSGGSKFTALGAAEMAALAQRTLDRIAASKAEDADVNHD
jgi:hypothetical protein